MWRNRILFLILWVLSLVGISFFGGPVSYGFFLLLTFVPVVSFAYLIYVFFFYRIYQELDNKTITAGHTVPFYFTLVNEFPLCFCSICVRFFSGFSSISGLDADTEYELLPKAGVREQTKLVCRYRGEYEVGIRTVELTDYFRLIRLRFANRETLRVNVLPNLIDIDELISADLSQTMARESAVQQTEPDVLVRHYEPGDDPRQIHWKASARSGELLIRKKTGEERDGVYVLMGTGRFGESPETYLPLENRMMEIALALSLFFVKKSILTHVCYLRQGLEEYAVASLGSFDSFYQAICSVEFKESSSEERLLTEAAARQTVFHCKTAFLILHEWTDAAAQMVELLRENSVYAVVCIVGNPGEDRAPAGELPGLRVVHVSVDKDLKEAGL